jgi:hypothetical protein
MCGNARRPQDAPPTPHLADRWSDRSEPVGRLDDAEANSESCHDGEVFPRGASRMHDGRTLLFSEPSLHDKLQARLGAVVEIVDGWDADDLLGRTDDSLVEQIVEHQRVELVELLEDQQYAKEAETRRVDMQHDPRFSGFPGRPAMVATTFQDVVIPVRGDASLLAWQPSSFSFNPPVARLTSDAVTFTYQSPQPSSEALASEYGRWLEQVRSGVRVINSQIEQHNRALEAEARRRVNDRRSRLLANRSFTASLQIPVRRRSDAPVSPVPLRRRKLTLPTTPAKPFEPEPALSDELYEAALETIAGMGNVIERNPITFHKLHEPALRDHLLLQLNSQFEGNAIGEVFNGAGKTDILIRVGDRNVFIAECKKWRGAAKFPEAIDQLLGYQTWRDTKAAIVLFIAQRNAQAIVEQAAGALRSHAAFIRDDSTADLLRRVNVMLCALDDERHEIRVALLPIVVPPPRDVAKEGDS